MFGKVRFCVGLNRKIKTSYCLFALSRGKWGLLDHFFPKSSQLKVTKRQVLPKAFKMTSMLSTADSNTYHQTAFRSNYTNNP